MRNLICGVVLAFLVGTPVAAQEGNFYRIGSSVNYGGLVKDADVTIQYVMFDPKAQVATLSVRHKECGTKDMLSIALTKGEKRVIAVKNDCTIDGCKTILVELTLSFFLGDSIRLEEVVRIVPSRTN